MAECRVCEHDNDEHLGPNWECDVEGCECTGFEGYDDDEDDEDDDTSNDDDS